ncbi:MAG: DUF3418 domain-containing protein, partial [Candidatus Aminicenantes bacterium]|nr:DUF3418 domain-containing protein [Candidatus Aminicenantes bacterium]
QERWERTNVTAWDFGPLPECVPLGGGVAAFPALEPSPSGVTLRLFKTRAEAEAVHPKGVEALLLPKFAKDLKYMERHLSLPEEFHRAALFFGGPAAVEKAMLGRLTAQIFRGGVRTPAEFRALSEGVVRALFERGKAILEATTRVLDGVRRLRAGLKDILAGRPGNKAVASAVERVQEELELLVPKNFLEVCPDDRLAPLARFLDALRVRAERAGCGPEKDRQKGEEVKPFLDALAGLRNRAGAKPLPALAAALEDFRWAVEEYKVAVFAPEVKTAFPVSAKRLADKHRALKAMVEAECPTKSRPKPGAVRLKP